MHTTCSVSFELLQSSGIENDRVSEFKDLEPINSVSL